MNVYDYILRGVGSGIITSEMPDLFFILENTAATKQVAVRDLCRFILYFVDAEDEDEYVADVVRMKCVEAQLSGESLDALIARASATRDTRADSYVPATARFTEVDPGERKEDLIAYAIPSNQELEELFRSSRGDAVLFKIRDFFRPFVNDVDTARERYDLLHYMYLMYAAYYNSEISAVPDTFPMSVIDNEYSMEPIQSPLGASKDA